MNSENKRCHIKNPSLGLSQMLTCLYQSSVSMPSSKTTHHTSHTYLLNDYGFSRVRPYLASSGHVGSSGVHGPHSRPVCSSSRLPLSVWYWGASCHAGRAAELCNSSNRREVARANCVLYCLSELINSIVHNCLLLLICFRLLRSSLSHDSG